MRIAVIGGGIAGVSLSWYLVGHKNVQVDLFDPAGIGGGSSGISTGLLYPFPGKRAFYSLEGKEAMQETINLIDLVEKLLEKEVASRTGIFRPAIDEEQKKDFQRRAQENSEAVWCDKKPFGNGLWIESGITIFSSLFLKGLWQASQVKGAKLLKEKVDCLGSLSEYDRIVIATGARTLKFPECKHLPIEINKGQALLCKWKEPLDFSLVSKGHISLTEDPSLCYVGSTYEHHFQNLDPDPKVALALLDQVSLFYPAAKNFEVVQVVSGGRVAKRGDYRPLIEKISPKTWVFTALGSRGLLYGPKFAKELSLKMEF